MLHLHAIAHEYQVQRAVFQSLPSEGSDCFDSRNAFPIFSMLVGIFQSLPSEGSDCFDLQGISQKVNITVGEAFNLCPQRALIASSSGFVMGLTPWITFNLCPQRALIASLRHSREPMDPPSPTTFNLCPQRALIASQMPKTGGLKVGAFNLCPQRALIASRPCGRKMGDHQSAECFQSLPSEGSDCFAATSVDLPPRSMLSISALRGL